MYTPNYNIYLKKLIMAITEDTVTIPFLELAGFYMLFVFKENFFFFPFRQLSKTKCTMCYNVLLTMVLGNIFV